MSKVVMERSFEQAVSEEMIEQMKKTAEACLELNSVVREQTFLSADRKRFVCIFDAPDTEAVRRAMESAGMDYDQVWAATVF